MAMSWPGAYWRMAVWHLAELRLYLPVLSAVLILQGAGFALGVGLLFGTMPQAAAIFLVTGAPVMNLITTGLIFEPQLVAEQRTRGTYEFLQSLPVPRSAAALAWYTVALGTALPAVILTLVAGVARYHLSLTVTPMVVPAMLLTCLTGVLLGLAIAHGITAPMAAELASTTLIFVMFGFSPVALPASQLPGWLAAVNQWLPFGSMATIVRAALVNGVASGVPRAYLVVAAWAAGSALVVAWAQGHRR
ncbi:ABC transporter permease [Trebonia kvetii]|uniref:ABC transporter permease n=1 Tax=Trebonia kvetii TaxID=2480626 RepID=A0A6P2BX16_9ACTN|nr:ABC transporter permease [Trebonia kvetii]TVZ03460.1 ABC transporter permease [Trebonia kvetii]